MPMFVALGRAQLHTKTTVTIQQTSVISRCPAMLVDVVVVVAVVYVVIISSTYNAAEPAIETAIHSFIATTTTMMMTTTSHHVCHFVSMDVSFIFEHEFVYG